MRRSPTDVLAPVAGRAPGSRAAPAESSPRRAGRYLSDDSGPALRSVAPDPGIELNVMTDWRVVPADAAVLLREGRASRLGRSGFEVVGQAGDAMQLLSLVREHTPDLVLVD